MQYTIGVDIGGTKCAVTLGRQNPDTGKLILEQKKAFPTQVDRGVEHTLANLFDQIETIMKEGALNARDIEAIGISCGGPLDSKKGIILSPPNLIGWDQVPIKERVEQRYGIPAYLQNDANACALAEWKFGAAKGFDNVIFLTFGTGLGAGLILDGKLYSGTNDMAGEVGHIRLTDMGPVGYGKAGSFEGFCSGGGIAQLARMLVLEKMQQGEQISWCSGMEELEKLDARTVGLKAVSGDPLAQEILHVCGSYLGRGLSILVDILNPQIIVLGSIFARCREFIWPAASGVMERECLKLSRGVCQVVPAGLGESIGDYGAQAVALCRVP